MAGRIQKDRTCLSMENKQKIITKSAAMNLQIEFIFTCSWLNTHLKL